MAWAFSSYFYPSPFQFRHPPPPYEGAYCRNSTPLFNKQFVSDVSSTDTDLIVCEMSLEVAVSPSHSPPSSPLLPSSPCRQPETFGPLPGRHACDRPIGVIVCVCVERSDAILKGLQLHLNGIIGHDRWLLPSSLPRLHRV